MQETPKVFLQTSSITFKFNLPLDHAATVAASAPTAEHSTKLAIPIMNRPVITKKIKKGIIPALSNLILSIKGIFLSFSGRTGPNSGCNLHLI